ncbi:MAG: SDR family oxidoreductase [Pseudomonadota bacterium]
MKGRHAVVTGGGTGIGRAIAEGLRDAGAAVTVTGRRMDVLAEVPGCFPMVMDVSSESSVLEGLVKARAARGPIHIAVANAGVAEGASLRNTDAEMWRRIMAINLDGCYHLFRACLPDMLAENWGRAIAISSIAGLKGLKGAPAYTASKHGMIGLVRGLAADLVGKPVTVNALCPAYVDTEIVTRNADAIAARTGLGAEAARDAMVSANPHGRLIDVDEVAAAALWLCGEGARSVHGQAIQIAGGEF